MTELPPKMPILNTYEHLAYLLVGGVFIVINPPIRQYLDDFRILDQWWEILPVAYLFGHLMQAVANLITDLPWSCLKAVNRTEKSETLKRIVIARARQYFHLPDLDDGATWRLCYVWALPRDPTGHIALFNSYYSLYRGLFIVAVLQTVSAVASSLASSNWRHEVFVILVASMLAFLMCRRARRFYAYTEERVLQIFYLGMKDTPHEKA